MISRHVHTSFHNQVVTRTWSVLTENAGIDTLCHKDTGPVSTHHSKQVCSQPWSCGKGHGRAGASSQGSGACRRRACTFYHIYTLTTSRFTELILPLHCSSGPSSCAAPSVRISATRCLVLGASNISSSLRPCSKHRATALDLFFCVRQLGQFQHVCSRKYPYI